MEEHLGYWEKDFALGFGDPTDRDLLPIYLDDLLFEQIAMAM